MKLSNGNRAYPVLVLIFFALTLSCVSARVGRANFGHRRLLNLSGNSVETNDETNDEVPAVLDVQPGNHLLHTLKGTGYQEYVFTGAAWKQINVSAVLSTFAGQDVGQHYYLPAEDADGGQPTWETFSPHSYVTGKAQENVTVSSNSIPWVLLRATSNSGPSSQFGSVTYIQRLFTSLGLPPDSSVPAKTGDIYWSPYSATYFLYQEG